MSITVANKQYDVVSSLMLRLMVYNLQQAAPHLQGNEYPVNLPGCIGLLYTRWNAFVGVVTLEKSSYAAPAIVKALIEYSFPLVICA